MKKVFILVAIVFLTTVAFTQTIVRAETEQKITANDELTFKSQKEKDTKIESLEKLIEHRLSQGKTESQMKKYYEELEKMKKAVVLRNEEEK